ncbi:MAG: thermonuclease family protein [Gemmatimonadetes bacterium]|nr:thermonuclease family protein [Gemmatimonadota bacterium]
MASRRIWLSAVLAASLSGSGQSVLWAQALPPSAAVCVVARLADGDSLTCTDGRKVRLLLMDTPELQQKPWGLMAKRQLETLAGPGTVLRLELDRNPTDRYGRTLAYAWAGNVLVNERMVANGWAVVLAYEDVRYLERMQRAERTAQAAKKGFWQAWAFRCRPVDFRAHRCGDSPAPGKNKSRARRGRTGTD